MLNNLKTLYFEFLGKTKTVKAYIDFEQSKGHLTEQILCDLHFLFNWATHHIEVSTLILTSTSQTFGANLSCEYKDSNTNDFYHFLALLREIIQMTFHLPQIVVVDIRHGATFLGADLMIGADFRFMEKGGTIQFNHLERGVFPFSHSMGLLGLLVGRLKAQNWLLGGRPILEEELLHSGFIYATDATILDELLHILSLQAPVQRIQVKKVLCDLLRKDLDHFQCIENQAGLAALSTDDWREGMKAEKEKRRPLFKTAKELQLLLKNHKTQ